MRTISLIIPILALVHCASGNRVGALLAIRVHALEGKSAGEALQIGRDAGLTGLEDAVERRLEGPSSGPTP